MTKRQGRKVQRMQVSQMTAARARRDALLTENPKSKLCYTQRIAKIKNKNKNVTKELK